MTAGSDEGASTGHHQHLGVPDRLAEEVVEELDLRPTDEAELPGDELPTLSEQVAHQLGGVRGLIESSIPVLAFVLLNVLLGSRLVGLDKHDALIAAIAGSVGTAVLIGLYRLWRREPVRHAVNGVIGIALGAYLAYRSGNARDFYLPGILLTLGEAALLVGSVAVRRPIIGYVWAITANRGRHDWLGNPALHFTFQWLTVAWAASLVVRGGTQLVLYLADEPNLLGAARIFLSWPIYAGMLALTVWAVRRVTHHRTLAS